MKTFLKLLCITLCLTAPALALAAVTSEPVKTKPVVPALTQQTVTITAKIVKIDYRTGLVSLKDKNGKTFEVTVTQKSGIDLSIFKVGDTVEATIAYVSVPDPSGMRASISKQQLIKLQKKK